MVNSFLPFGRIYRMESAGQAIAQAIAAAISDSNQGLTHHNGSNFGA